MARNGVWQLKRLLLSYCDFGGSSRGARQFLGEVLPEFVAENPQIAVSQTVSRGQHPFLRAEYANSSQRVVGVKNLGAEDILRHGLWLRGSAGRKTAHRVKDRQITGMSSVQGGWTPTLDLGQQLQWANGVPTGGAALSRGQELAAAKAARAAAKAQKAADLRAVEPTAAGAA